MEKTTIYSYALCFLLCLATTTLAVPFTSLKQATRELDGKGKDVLTKPLNEHVEGEDKAKERLTERKEILEEMLKDTNSKLSGINGVGSSKRYIAKDPLMDYPKRSTISESGRELVPERSLGGDGEKPISSAAEIERLQAVLKQLNARLKELESDGEKATIAAPSGKAASDSAKSPLYMKLEDLDIDLHKLLGTDSNHGYGKSFADNSDIKRLLDTRDNSPKMSNNDIYKTLLDQMRH